MKNTIYINCLLVILGVLFIVFRKQLAEFLTIFQSIFLDVFNLAKLKPKFLKFTEFLVAIIGIFIVIFGLTGIFKS